jgi:MOSC domain-containing protein YiiM
MRAGYHGHAGAQGHIGRKFKGAMSGRLEAINISRGGVPKQSVFEALITEHGVAGDHQNDPYYHGGVNRAVVLFSLEVIRKLQGEGHPITPGAVGENLTVSGIEWETIVPGRRLTVGDVELEITRYATPCQKIRVSFLGEDFMRIFQDRHPGWSRVCARVVKSGIVRPGDAIAVVSVDAA